MLLLDGGSGSGAGAGTSGTSSHRVRDTVRSIISKPTSSGSGSSGVSSTGGSKPGFSDNIRKHRSEIII